MRSKETRHLVSILGALTIILATIGFCVDGATGMLVLCAAVLLEGAFGLYLHNRNRRIAHMTEEIDKVLHNADHIYISDGDEGELAVLQSEVAKMTQRIREQNSALKREKEHLADSLAGIAHQLRTPLTSMNMILSFVETAKDSAEKRTLIREADGLLRQMDTLLTALLKLSRLDAGVIELQLERIDVEILIAKALSPLEIPMEVLGITVEKTLPPNASIIVDNTWMTEALQNILKNSMESAGEHGLIKIHCEDTLLYTLITIHDSGKGFQKEDMPHVFERFYRGKNAKTVGFGIGLSLSKTIIDRHGGLITAANHPTGGALFSIKLYK